MKKNLTPRNIIGLIIAVALLVFIINPYLIPFIDEATKAKIAITLKNTFGFYDSDGPSALNLPNIISIIAVILIVTIVSKLLRLIIEKTSMKKNRGRTVAGLILSVIKYASVIVAIVWCLGILGVNVTGIFASLGIVSLVIGFGAQSLIEDIITGVFIIFEGQYNVGDIIILDDFRGTVSKIGVRTTSLVDAGGNVKIVNNSDIRNVQNRSENLSIAICDVGISYDVRVEDVEKIISRELPIIGERNKDVFLEAPIYAGVQSLGESAVVLRFLVKVKEENIFPAQRRLNRAIKVMFDDNNIEIPLNQLVLHNAYK